MADGKRLLSGKSVLLAVTRLVCTSRTLVGLCAGACVVAHTLATSSELNDKLDQVYKEAVAIWYKNAIQGPHVHVCCRLAEAYGSSLCQGRGSRLGSPEA